MQGELNPELINRGAHPQLAKQPARQLTPEHPPQGLRGSPEAAEITLERRLVPIQPEHKGLALDRRRRERQPHRAQVNRADPGPLAASEQRAAELEALPRVDLVQRAAEREVLPPVDSAQQAEGPEAVPRVDSEREAAVPGVTPQATPVRRMEPGRPPESESPVPSECPERTGRLPVSELLGRLACPARRVRLEEWGLRRERLVALEPRAALTLLALQALRVLLERLAVLVRREELPAALPAALAEELPGVAQAAAPADLVAAAPVEVVAAVLAERNQPHVASSCGAHR